MESMASDQSSSLLYMLASSSTAFHVLDGGAGLMDGVRFVISAVRSDV